MTDRFPFLSLSGSAEERGATHGSRLRDSIAATVAFYASLLKMTDEDVLATGRYFRKQIQEFHPPFCTEIDALADAAQQPPEWIYLLNARSELISYPAECSTIVFRDSSLMGQNWDFARPLYDHAVLMQVTLESGHSFLTLTEPGIIGKIGLNSCGLGVCLNLLRLKRRCGGVPLHILLRAVLESDDIEKAKGIVVSAPSIRVGCITVGDEHNSAFSIEYGGESCWFLSSPGRISLHTNHFLGKHLTPENSANTSSFERFKTLARLTMILHQQDISTMQRLLSDRSNSSWPVYMSWSSSSFPGMGEVGTIATLIMELPQKVLHIRKGNDPANPFFSYSVTQSAEPIHD